MQDNEQDIELLRARAKAKAKAMRMREESSAGDIDPVSNEVPEGSLQELEAQATFGTMLELGKQSLGFGTEGNVVAGGLGALESVPFAKDVFAGALTVADSGLEKFSENYNANKSALDKTINEAEEKYPASFNTGDIGYGIAMAGPTGLVGSMIYGGASALSRSEDRGVDDFLAGGTIGAAGWSIGNKVLPWIGRKLGIVADKGTGEVVGALGTKGKENLNNHVLQHHALPDDSLEDATHRWAQSLLKERTPDGKPLLTKFQSFKDTYQKAGKIKEEYGSLIGKVTREMDEALPEGISEEASKKMYRDIVDELDEVYGKSTDKEAMSAIDKIKRRLDDYFITKKPPVEKIITKQVPDNVSGGLTTVTEKITEQGGEVLKYNRLKLSDLQATKQYIDKTLRTAHNKGASDLGTEQILTKEYVGTLRKGIEQQVDDLVRAGKIDLGDPALKSFKQLNSKWADMHLVEGLAKKSTEKYQAGPYGILQNALATRGLLFGMLAGGADASRWAAASTVIAFNEMLSNPRTPAVLHGGIRALSEVFNANPQHPAIQDILTAASLSSDELRKSVTHHVGALKLGTQKVARDIQGAYMQSDSILSVLEYKDPDTAFALREAMFDKDDEAVAQIMDGVSRDPRFSKFIQSGIGWNGKVYKEEDKAILESQLKGDNSISYAQKLRHLESLRQEGIIPQVQPDPKPPLQHIPRRKDRHGY